MKIDGRPTCCCCVSLCVEPGRSLHSRERVGEIGVLFSFETLNRKGNKDYCDETSLPSLVSAKFDFYLYADYHLVSVK